MCTACKSKSPIFKQPSKENLALCSIGQDSNMPDDSDLFQPGGLYC